MLKDRYDNPLTTTSVAARDAYVEGVDHFLAATPGAVECIEEAVAADSTFALAHAALARVRLALGVSSDIQPLMFRAKALAQLGSDREKAHVEIIALIVSGSVT